MSDYSSSSELFLTELLRIASNLIWKDPKKVSDNEINTNSIEVEQYKLAVQGKLTFNLVYKFNKEVFLELGISDDNATLYSEDSSMIPIEIRDECLKRQIDYIINHYEDKNNYYRMLHGVPDMDDQEFLYNTEYPNISDSITPIHLLDISQLYELESVGYIQKLIDENPDKPYLNYMTDKKIDYYTARNAEDYSILWITASNYTKLLKDFKEVYNSCRYMILNLYYTRAMLSQNSLYQGFIGMQILFVTINQMQYRFLDADITRDFYDEDSLRLVYDSYQVPYYQQIPLEYHKKIVKNMNILMSHKGSTQVFYDLFDIFGLGNMSVFEFFMFKNHKVDSNGNPIFIKDEKGNYDYEKMYNIDFRKVTLYNDPMSEMSDSRNKVKYDALTLGDPYWIEDAYLKEKIYSEEYNGVESKYMGIQTTFNLMKILYETTYYLKMIIDNRKLLSSTAIYNNNTHTYCNIFDLVIYACALICQINGFEGNIPSDPHEIGKLMGFNFKNDLIVLKENITKNDHLKNDTALLTYLETMSVNSLASIEKIYSNLTELRSYLLEKMNNTDDVYTYWAYYELYNTIMYSEYVDDVFKKSNGEPAESFDDLLEDINPKLYDRLISEEVNDKHAELGDVLYLLKSSCSKLKEIEYCDNVNMDNIVEYLFKLLDFFKSAKAELTGYEVVYSLISKFDNIIKLMNLIDHITEHAKEPVGSIFDELTDLIHLIKDLTLLKDNIIRYDADIILINDKSLLKDMIEWLDDNINQIVDFIGKLSETFELEDYVKEFERIRFKDEPFEFDDRVKLLFDEIEEVIKYIVYDEHSMYDVILFITEKMETPQKSKLELLIKLFIIEAQSGLSETSLSDNMKIIFDNTMIARVKYVLLDSVMKILEESKLLTNHTFEDVASIIKETYETHKESLTMIDTDLTLIEIILTNIMTENQFITFTDQLISEVTKAVISSELLFHNEITSVDTSSHVSEFHQIDSTIESNNSSTMKFSIHGMDDMIKLRKEETFDE